MIRHLHQLIGGAAACALLLLGSTNAFASGPSAIDAKRSDRGSARVGADQQDQGPIEILIVQGYVKTIDEKSLTLTAPGAPSDLPLRLAPDTRFIQEEKDIARGAVHEGQLVRAALVPTGEEFVAVVVELVPDETGAQPPQGPSGSQAPDAGSKL